MNPKDESTQPTSAHVSGALPLITVLTPCFNEEDNVDSLYQRIKAAFATISGVRYQHVFIDNASSDGTVSRIKSIAGNDAAVKLIVNNRNFGHIRSPLHAFYEVPGDAVIVMASDLQDPPELLPQFVRNWHLGY